MVKIKTIFSCQSCGYQSPKWLGRCPACNEWNSLAEETSLPPSLLRDGVSISPDRSSSPIPIDRIKTDQGERIETEIKELDRVLGGGIVRGSLILIGGDPGIGKSTLLLQALNKLGEKKLKVLYVSGEESINQTKIRGDRLDASSSNLYILAENSLEKILEEIKILKPQCLVIDSIQTVYTTSMESAPGSVGQLRGSSIKLMYLAKKTGIPIFLIGHVTKEGVIAGPKVIEHLVDTVLYFEGDRGHPYRILRATKNRYGSTNEIGVFEMGDCGLLEVSNPSEIFLAERSIGVAGSVVVPSIKGTRPILVEVQALVSPAVFGTPRRTTLGVDHNRVSLLAAVLEKKAGFSLLNQDIFLNIAGGVKIDEPALDLGIATSIVSSLLNKSIDPKTIIFGEVGLAGEVRGISHWEMRVNEAVKLGFKKCLIPHHSKNLSNFHSLIDIKRIDSLRDVVEYLF